MSTPCGIYLQLHKKEKGTTITLDRDKLPFGTIGKYRVPKTHIKENVDFICTYCHWDGHPTNVGRVLIEHFNTHDKVLNLISGGEMSSMCGNAGVKYYKTWRNQIWNRTLNAVCPLQTSDSPSKKDGFPYHDCDYIYLFRNGRWFFKKSGEEHWNNLKNYLQKKKEI